MSLMMAVVLCKEEAPVVYWMRGERGNMAEAGGERLHEHEDEKEMAGFLELHAILISKL